MEFWKSYIRNALPSELLSSLKEPLVQILGDDLDHHKNAYRAEFKTPTFVDLTDPARTRQGASWWKVHDQYGTGACVGLAAADLLWWHFVKAGKASPNNPFSGRFIWMSVKETDHYTAFPTTFIEKAGVRVIDALKIAKQYGCVYDRVLPLVRLGKDSGNAREREVAANAAVANDPITLWLDQLDNTNMLLSILQRQDFYRHAAEFKIKDYKHLGAFAFNKNVWKAWLAYQGPILTRLDVDYTWVGVEKGARKKGAEAHRLRTYRPALENLGGHACLVAGYHSDASGEYLKLKNSWGTDWGDKGFAYAYFPYAEEAFREGHGIVV